MEAPGAGWIHLLSKELPDHQWMLYVGTSEGTLAWYRVVGERGTAEKIGQVSGLAKGAEKSFFSPNKSRLFVAGEGRVTCLAIDGETGAATVLSHSASGSRFSGLSPDGKFYYSFFYWFYSHERRRHRH